MGPLLVVSMVSLSFWSLSPLLTAPVHRACRAFAICVCVSFHSCCPFCMPSFSTSVLTHVYLFMCFMTSFTPSGMNDCSMCVSLSFCASSVMSCLSFIRHSVIICCIVAVAPHSHFPVSTPMFLLLFSNLLPLFSSGCSSGYHCEMTFHGNVLLPCLFIHTSIAVSCIFVSIMCPQWSSLLSPSLHDDVASVFDWKYIFMWCCSTISFILLFMLPLIISPLWYSLHLHFSSISLGLLLLYLLFSDSCLLYAFAHLSAYQFAICSGVASFTPLFFSCAKSVPFLQAESTSWLLIVTTWNFFFQYFFSSRIAIHRSRLASFISSVSSLCSIVWYFLIADSLSTGSVIFVPVYDTPPLAVLIDFIASSIARVSPAIIVLSFLVPQHIFAPP